MEDFFENESPVSLAWLESRALSLRDFFAAPGGEKLKRAVLDLAAFWPELEPPSDEGGWLELEYAFNRLFIGPGPVVAPPYASVYLEPEPRLMGRPAEEIRDLMKALGLTPPHPGQEPEDHISYELELWCVLARLFGQDCGGREEWTSAVCRALAWLTRDHLAVWAPLFIARIVEDRQAPSLIAEISIRLGRWIGAAGRTAG